jgi:hypothetical protein
VHRADRDLVEIFALDRKKRISRRPRRYRQARAERVLHVPKAEIEPWTHVWSASRLVSIETVNGALESDSRRMERAYGREYSGRTIEADDRDFAAEVLENCHMNCRLGPIIAP